MHWHVYTCFFIYEPISYKASALRRCIDHTQSKSELRLYTLQQLNTSNPSEHSDFADKGRRNLQDLWKVVTSFLYGCAKPTSKFPLCRHTHSDVIQKIIVLIVSSAHELRYNSMMVDQPVGTSLLKLAIWMAYNQPQCLGWECSYALRESKLSDTTVNKLPYPCTNIYTSCTIQTIDVIYMPLSFWNEMGVMIQEPVKICCTMYVERVFISYVLPTVTARKKSI